MKWLPGRLSGIFIFPIMLPGVLPGTGGTILLTGLRGAHFTGIPITDIIITGTIIITVIIVSGIIIAAIVTTTFITAVSGFIHQE